MSCTQRRECHGTVLVPMKVVDADLRPQIQAKLPRRAAPFFSDAVRKSRPDKPTSSNQFLT
jgi:hypothetical protein